MPFSVFSGYLKHFRVNRIVQDVWGFLYGCVCQGGVKLVAEERGSGGTRGLRRMGGGGSSQDGSIAKQGSSPHNHIKITTKIQNNHPSELSEIELNRSLTTTN